MIHGRLLSQFIAVAEELHFGRAAARLHMAQPPLSQAIKNLEEIVGVQLLARSRHSVLLTPAGSAFLEEARELMAHGQRAIDIARRASVGMTGNITIGFMGSVSYEFLPRLLRRFRAAFPAIHVDLREQISVEQIESLHASKIDLGIVRVPLSNATDLNLRVIEVERFVAVLPKDHRLAAAPSLRLEELAEESFLVFPAGKSPSLHSKFLMACDEAGFSPRVSTEAWQMASMVSLVAAGLGVTLLPAQVKNSPHKDVVYKELTNASRHLELEIAAAWRPDDISSGLQAMLSVLGEA
ncbi:LysR family transcriptional regulator [Herbaspirillum sp. NPDC087042]|uniref:LysR family transcriptional regulator n=1 Tax=Herbaspirillum sp. NPDC087042 TaxID=3364004 RepID=UPI00381721B0